MYSSTVTKKQDTYVHDNRIHAGNIVYIKPSYAKKPQRPQVDSITDYRSDLLVTKSSLAFPILIQIYYPKTQETLTFTNLSLRLRLLGIAHAHYRKLDDVAYIEKSELDNLQSSVQSHSGGSWQVKLFVKN